MPDQNLLYADMLALLPEVEQDQLVAESAKVMAAEGERRLVFVLSTDQADDLSRISANFSSYLKQTRQFAADQDPFTETASLFAYRYQLLRAQQAQLLTQSADVMVQQALTGLYGAFGALRAAALMSDPLGLHMGYMGSFAQG
ncbi:MAG: hypothetical protein O3A63_12175, partial [Proteobacteria bacterium]|nr:hypothetical protein [Pseudomonadota bacterium]